MNTNSLRGRRRIGRRLSLALPDEDRQHLEAVAKLRRLRGAKGGRTVHALVREAVRSWCLAHPVGPSP